MRSKAMILFLGAALFVVVGASLFHLWPAWATGFIALGVTVVVVAIAYWRQW